ncbi:MAG TPA: alpha-glucuronidase family glycosyl hydrolase [Tepidisphaeraceae bacterium]|nr:alpha-glucuronidase family glycosyl hydrolase [Tepidisphaeraceae bacterium]
MPIKNLLKFALIVVLLVPMGNAQGEDGYAAWLRYVPLDEGPIRTSYRAAAAQIALPADSVVLRSAAAELQRGLTAMLAREVPVIDGAGGDGAIILVPSLAEADAAVREALNGIDVESLGPEGFALRSAKTSRGRHIIIAANSDGGVLYGSFALLRHLQLGQRIDDLDVRQRPRIPLRVINHWDNLDGSVERGYAGGSIFWGEGVPSPDQRHTDYARLLASVGIHGICINNVNAGKGRNVQMLSRAYLQRAAVIAERFRAYGVRLYLSAGFDSPRALGGLETADPLDPKVRQWWREKTEEIYELIPDFGGFVVKADSEGQPGPYVYGRNHAEGANMLAAALQPHSGIVMWRAFVYDSKGPDRAAMASENFLPLDGDFAENVLVQIKNGPIDFQVREPVHPLFGKLPATRAMLELQVTQEYTGQDVHLCYLVPMWKEALDFDTHARGAGSSVTGVLDGSVHSAAPGGITAVANLGRDRNWLGHHLHMANLYGYGRLAWAPELDAREIAEQWVRLSFSSDPVVLETIVSMLMDSRAIYERYTSPMGLGVLHEGGPHFDPAPHIRYAYHKADSRGVGFDRTRATGSGYTSLYHRPVAQVYETLETCPEELLLFFHHVPYTHRLKNGKTVIQHLYDSYYAGVEQARRLRAKWVSLEGKIDDERYEHVLDRLTRQIDHAAHWRDTMTLFFFQLSGIADEKKRVRSDYRLRHINDSQ